MTDKPFEDDRPDDAAFERTLRNLASTPPTPHVKRAATKSAKKKGKDGASAN